MSRLSDLSNLVTRFAPAPTGFLHLGHVVNAMYVWNLARAAGAEGRVLLRIEDHDRSRSRDEFETAIIVDLAWLGFEHDGPIVRQSERGEVYEQALEILRRQGVVYACECSRSTISSRRYPGTCRAKGLAEGPGRGIRIRLEPSVERFDDLRLGPQVQRPSEQGGDLLARDRHGHWTYQFAVVVDDWLQGVTHVVRGEDLLESTGRQIQLARLIGREVPPAFLHHPLVMKRDSQKLSKSDRDTGIRDLRAKGWTAEQVKTEALRRIGIPASGLPPLAFRL